MNISWVTELEFSFPKTLGRNRNGKEIRDHSSTETASKQHLCNLSEQPFIGVCLSDSCPYGPGQIVSPLLVLPPNNLLTLLPTCCQSKSSQTPEFCLRKAVLRWIRSRGLPNLRFTPVISETWKVCMRFHADVNAGPRGRITSVLSPASSLKLSWLNNFSEDYSKENMCLYSTYHLFFLLKNEMLRPLIQREVLKASGWDHRIVSLQEYFRMIAITQEMLQKNPPWNSKLQIIQ